MRSPAAVAVFLLGAAASAAQAQQLEPRAYSPNPTGANFLVLGYGRSTGDVVTDPSLPVRDVEATINNTSLLYGRTFGAFGRSASATLVLPYVWGSVEGEVAETQRRVTRSAFADVGLRLAANLVGGPALAPREFVRHRPVTTLGASLWVFAPTGEYDPDKLVNLGTNRWTFKPELGLSYPRGKWSFEVYGGAWLYTDNDAFFGGTLREQQPIATFQGHVVYSFKPRLWLAGDATFYSGGRTTIGGVENQDAQENSRLGLTLALPLGRHFSAKAAWTTGFTTRVGGSFDTVSIGLQYLWLD
jgi:hypothetical protein